MYKKNLRLTAEGIDPSSLSPGEMPRGALAPAKVLISFGLLLARSISLTHLAEILSFHSCYRPLCTRGLAGLEKIRRFVFRGRLARAERLSFLKNGWLRHRITWEKGGPGRDPDAGCNILIRYELRWTPEAAFFPQSAADRQPIGV